MAVPSTVADLSITAASNSPAGSDAVATNSGPDEYLRALGSILRREQAQFTAVASATTVDLGAIATGNYGHVTGTTTITGFGTVAAGIERTLVFDGILTLTHNATSLILRTGANRTTAAGDVGVFVSEGSGNWREKAYHTALTSYQPLDAQLTTLAAITAQQAADLAAVSTFIGTVLNDADAATARATLGSAAEVSTQTIWMPAGAMTPRTTNGAASGTAETTTNKVMIKTLDFDATADEHAQFTIRMPKGWDEGTLTYTPVWSHAATTTNFGVAWFVQAVAISNDDTLEVAFGTAVSSVDTGGTTDDAYIGPASSAMTVAGTPAAEDLVLFQIYRDVSDAGDTLAVDARLHGVTINYTTASLNDA